MPQYRYSAINTAGKCVQGVIVAENVEIAKEILRKDKLVVTKLHLFSSPKKGKEMDAALLIAFTRDMAQLLRAGLPVYESLQTIEEKLEESAAKPLLTSLLTDVRQGKSLSFAFSEFPKTFNPIYCSMIASAERSGSLKESFEELYKLLVRQNKLKKQLISSLTYPALLASFCIAVTLSLFLFVVPSMKELFEGRELHPMTEMVLAISSFLQSYGKILLSVVAALGMGFFFSIRSQKGKKFWYQVLHKVPLLKTLLLQSALIRFSRTFSLLFRSGVPLIEALELSSQVTRHPLLEEVIQQGAFRVLQGEKLSRQFNHPLLPPLVARMISIAEETGKMSEMLYSLSDIYEEELERQLSQITSLLQPLLLLLLGAIIGLVVLSILLPLTDVSSFV